MATEFPALSALRAEGALVSALAVRLGENRVLATSEPERPLSPASVTKLYTAAAALETWGPEHRFSTYLYVRGPLRNGQLDGDLVLRGGGDPALTEDKLRFLAEEAARLGLREVTGGLVVDDSRFGPLDCNVKDRCEAEAGTINSYDAPISAVGVNFSNVAVLVVPGEKPGDPARVALDPTELPSLALEAKVKTVARGGQLFVGRVTRGDRDILQVTGSINVDRGPVRVWRSIANASLHTGELFLHFLTRAGITVKGETQVESTVSGVGEPLADVEGQPLWQTLHDMQRFSNNVIADAMALSLLAEREDAPVPLTIAAAGGNLQSYGQEISTNSSLPSSRASELTLFDGSGLIPENRVSARDLVALLAHIYDRYALFPSFLGSLVVPEFAAGRSLRRTRDPDWLQRLAVKSGGLGEPVSVVTLAGYLRLPDGSWCAFATLVNGTPKRRSVSRAKVFEAIRKDLARLPAAQ